jgi:hypothetical protein
MMLGEVLRHEFVECGVLNSKMSDDLMSDRLCFRAMSMSMKASTQMEKEPRAPHCTPKETIRLEAGAKEGAI